MKTDNQSGPWMRLRSGNRFYPLSPTPELIEIEDIAHALGNLCRFGGHTREFYSVAQHCVMCSLVTDAESALAALLHDATEAYLVDVPKPIKNLLPAYINIEDSLATCIEEKFGLLPGALCSKAVKDVDARMLVTEAVKLLGLEDPAEWGYSQKPFECDMTPWPPELAKRYYLNRFRQLTNIP